MSCHFLLMFLLCDGLSIFAPPLAFSQLADPLSHAFLALSSFHLIIVDSFLTPQNQTQDVTVEGLDCSYINTYPIPDPTGLDLNSPLFRLAHD
ncbi:hypothetical protein BDV26DRAFT_276971 [Aspergillus bertholletiae]|uniref:Secreted protein n=1 Tax=Aspergillus bertholletiae TaxID=1226010 RepID=A0A5N7AQF5_9EURO|nr:hypothetical protein BDV26DRAFT_276971 [Aspergillus bertholletiae]